MNLEVLEEKEAVNHPQYYGGEENPFEPIKVIEHYNLNFSLGCAIKYILRAGIKDKTKKVEDLQKAAWYINREIERLEKNGNWWAKRKNRGCNYRHR